MRFLITGASGQLGGYLLRELTDRDESVIAWSGSRTGQLFGFPLRPVNLTQPELIEKAFREARPDLVIHMAAITRIADAYSDPAHARMVNVEGTAALAAIAQQLGVRFVHVSTDLVFNGEKGPYRENDPPTPLSVYGQTKANAEREALSRGGSVIRVSLLFGPSVVDRPSFFDQQIRALLAGSPVALFEDEWRTPLSFAAAARALLSVACSDFTGLLHVGGPERLSRLDMGRRLAELLGCGNDAIVAATRAGASAPEARPRDTSLDSSLWRERFADQPWPTWSETVQEMSLASGVGEM